MRIVIQPAQMLVLQKELASAGDREIGGVLVGEHLEGDTFRLLDLSVQRRGGGRTHFRRDPKAAAAFVDRIILAEGGDPTKVNYLGEWHSHPNMSACPSVTDLLQMQAIMENEAEVATFGALIVVSARPTGLELSATFFRAGHAPEPADLEISQEDAVIWRLTSSEAQDDLNEVTR